MTPLTHIAHICDTFPMHFDKLAMDFSSANVFVFKIESVNAPHIQRLVINVVLYKALS
jgi:hypothetical protein